MKLIGYEFCKLLHKKILLLIWFLTIAILLFTFYEQCEKKNIYDKELFFQLSEQFSTMEPEAALSKLKEDHNLLLYCYLQENDANKITLQTLLESFDADSRKTPDETWEEYKTYGGNEILLENTLSIVIYLEQQYQYIEDYKTFLSEMPSRAETMKSFSVFAKPDSFSYRHISKSVEDYGRLEGISITGDYDQGVLALAEDRYSILFLLVILLFAAGVLYPEEVDSKMISLLTANKRGRFPLALAKWITLELFAALTALFVSLAKILLADNILGFGNLSRPLQSISYFRNCCYWINVREYLASTVFFWVLVMLFAGGLLSLLLWLFQDVKVAGGIYGTCLLTNYLSYRFIDDASMWNAWKFINFFSFGDVSGRFSVYQNLNFFGFPISIFLSGCIFFVVLMTAMLTGYLVSFTRCFQLLLPSIKLYHKKRIKGNTKLWLHEMYRLWVSNYGIIILMVLVFLCYRSMEKDELLLSLDDYNYYAYSQQILGELTPETDQWIAEENEKFSNITEISIQLEKQYAQGEIDEITYLRESFNLEQFSQKQKAFNEIYSQYTTLKEVQERGIPVHFINTIATDAMFDNMTQYVYNGMLFILICVFSLCGMFSNDYHTNMIFLVHTTRNGRVPLFRTKYRAMLTLYSLGFLCHVAAYWYNWLVPYRMYDWNAPLQSILQFTNVHGNISILQFVVLWFIEMYLCGIAFIILQAMLSCVCHKNSTVLIVSVICIALDFLISGFSFRWISMLALSSGFGLPMLLQTTCKVQLVWLELAKSLFVITILFLWHRNCYIQEL